MGNLEAILKEQKRKVDSLKETLEGRYRCIGEFTDLVFVTSMGSPVSRYSAEKQINILRDEMNLEEKTKASVEGRQPELLEKIGPHIIRHTFATRCFESGIDPKIVQQLLGHAHYSTTIDIYTHVLEGRMREECEKFKI